MTPATNSMADMLPTFVAAIPFGRAAQPIEIANAIAYLCSESRASSPAPSSRSTVAANPCCEWLPTPI